MSNIYRLEHVLSGLCGKYNIRTEREEDNVYKLILNNNEECYVNLNDYLNREEELPELIGFYVDMEG